MVEICRLVCCYEPAVVDHGQYVVDTRNDSGDGAWDILNMAEFRSVVAASGRVGYLKHPLLGLRRVCDALQRLIRKLTRQTPSQIGNYGREMQPVLGAWPELPVKPSAPWRMTTPAVSTRFSFHSARLNCRCSGAALRVRHPWGFSTTRQQLCFFHAHTRRGKVAHSWLNTGEERKLEMEAKKGVSHRLANAKGTQGLSRIRLTQETRQSPNNRSQSAFFGAREKKKKIKV